MSHLPFRVLLLILLLASGSRMASAAPPVSKADQLQLSADVRGIFEAKCLDCHGPELARPKGKFGYVLDLKRLAANPKHIVPGKPQESDLYDQVFNDDMPGEDANVPPLT